MANRINPAGNIPPVWAALGDSLTANLPALAQSDPSPQLAKVPAQPDPSPQLAKVPAQPDAQVQAQEPSPAQQQIANDQQTLQKLQTPKTPWHQLSTGHKIGRVFADIGNVAGDIFAPRVMANIPGTDLNHMMQERYYSNRLQNEITQDADNQEKQAQTAHENEMTKEAPQELADAEGAQQVNAQNLQSEIAQRGKPTTPEMETYRSLIGLGMSPPQALQEIERDKQLSTRPPNISAKTLALPDGKQVAGKVDSQGNLLLADGSSAPSGTKLYQQPNYGMLMLPTKTTTYIDPNTKLPTLYHWNTKTNDFDIPVGLSATGGYGHQAAQAGAVERSGEALIQRINENRAVLGNLGAWVQKYGLDTPIADPTLNSIRVAMKSFADLNPAMHGARGEGAMSHFEKLVGDLQQNPDASIAGIRAIIDNANEINPSVNVGGNSAAPGTQNQEGQTSLGTFLGNTSRPDGKFKDNKSGRRFIAKGGRLYETTN